MGPTLPDQPGSANDGVGSRPIRDFMTDTGAGGSSGNAEDSEQDSASIQDVLDAVGPFIEQADHLGGFAVRYADARSASRATDYSTVEVRIYYPQRHPEDADKLMGMLQGHGFNPAKRKRGSESSLCIYLTVSLDGSEAEDYEPRGGGEQGSL